MNNEGSLELDLELHRTLRSSLPSSWNAFFARFGHLRPIQVAAIPAVLQGKDLLVTAPTAGGKTEAVVAPICERLIHEKWPGLSSVLITPTRALVNDLFERLDGPIGDMGIKLARKTSDHAISESMTENFLITTPESLESLLTFRRDRLQTLRAIILDEIHLLDGTPRGDQLRGVIQRLRLFLSRIPQRPISLQMLALSATLPNPRQTAARYLGENFDIVSVAGQRSIIATVIVATGDDQSRAEAAIRATDAFDDVRKMLVFYNSRKAVDSTGHFFQTGRFASATMLCHHGSLAKAERENAEQRFKQDRFAVCVSTMTLEIGIDIGDVDLVVCMSPPAGICSFLQRIGRGCRRLQGATRVLCVARDRAEELIFESMIAAARQPLAAGPQVPFRRTVLIQQVLAYLRQVGNHRRTLAQIKTALSQVASPGIDDNMLQAVLHDMCIGDLITAHNGVYEPASRGWEFIQSRRIYSNIESPPKGIQIVDVETGKQISTAAGISSDGGTQIRVAGRPFEVVGTQGSRVSVRGTKDSLVPPDYESRRFPYAYDVGVALAERIGCLRQQLFAVEGNDTLFVMTWLGKLQNSLLASVAKRHGVDARAFCFSMRIPITHTSSLFSLLQQVVKEAVQSSEIEGLVVERVVDFGPYLSELSTDGQRACRRDWLDRPFLEQWINQITKIEIIRQSDPRASDMLCLASVE